VAGLSGPRRVPRLNCANHLPVVSTLMKVWLFEKVQEEAGARVYPIDTKAPHPEERPAGPRLEGWQPHRACCPCFETLAPLAPQHEVVGW
jgi:hypothetical protein